MQRENSATGNERILQRVTSDILQWATSVTSRNRISQRVKNEFLQRATSVTSNKQILQRVTSTTGNEWFYKEQRATSEFQRVTSNEWKVTPPFTFT